ncbi:helix-turn-helix transcriptional regulator [Halarchaeum salinum]|uniref:DUF4897 domain-containing protein n=1 Tax=Halarchaeum salinum TaxID=489912 RepID=A0AAV3SB15_9EURY
MPASTNSVSGVDPDSVALDVALTADGDAVWTVTYRKQLNSGNETDAFRQLREDIEANPGNYTTDFGAQMRRVAGEAQNRSGREMAVRNVTVNARIQQFGNTYGIITYRFRWTSFAATQGEHIRAGPAVADLFLDSETSLTISWPDGYAAEQVAPTPTGRSENAVTWTGRLDFGVEEPLVVVAPMASATTTGSDTEPAAGSEATPGSWLPVVGVGIVLAAIGVWLVVGRRRFESDDGDGSGVDGSSEDDPTTPADGDGATPTAGTGDADVESKRSEKGDSESSEPTESTVEPESSDAESAGDGTETVADVPEELLSNEERVLSLIEEHGGRMKQQQVVSELGWTEAKTSQVVSGLREDDELESFRIGRENVLTLPDEDDTGI